MATKSIFPGGLTMVKFFYQIKTNGKYIPTKNE